MTTALRVAYVIWTYPKASETFVSSEIQAVRRLGIEAQVIAGQPESAARVDENTLYPARFPGLAGLLGGLRQLPFAARMATDVREFVTAWWLAIRLKRQLNRFAPDVIHSHFANNPTLAALILARWLHRPATAMFHANDYLVAISGTALRRRTQQLQQICVISQAARADVIERTGVDPARVTVVRAAVAESLVDRPPAPELRPRIVTVARLVPKKGHRPLLDGFAELVRRGDTTTELVLIGDGPEQAAIEARIEELDLAGRVRLAGALPHQAAIELLWNAEVAALTAVVTGDGDADGIPVFLMEAAAAARPIVSTPVGGVRELITDGVSGRLLTELTPTAVADALAEAMGPGQAWGEAARAQLVTEFAPHRQAERLRELWTHLARRSSAESGAAG